MTKYKGLLLAGLVIGIILIIVTPVSGAEHIISPGANAIQNAITTTAADGDTILLNQGTYSEHDIVVSKNITIGANPADSANAGNTFIDAGLSGRIFSVTGNYSLTIDSLTLRNGKAPDGTNGGVFENGGHGGDGGAISSFGSVTVLSSVLSGCSAGNGGSGGLGSFFTPGGIGGTGGSGGAVNSTYDVTITDSTITDCHAGNGGTGGNGDGDASPGGNGGIGGSGGAVSSDYPITITSSTISDCSAGTGGTAGLPGNTMWGDQSGYGGDGGSGGGLNTKTSHGPVTVTFSDITGCSAGNGGTSYDNRGGDGGNGGAIASLGPVTVTSSTISTCSAGAGGDSTTYDDGYGGGGGAVYGYLEGEVTVSDSTITGNHAGNGRTNTISGPGRFDSGGPGGYGGAIYLYSVSSGIANVTFSSIANNAAGNSGNGGAIASQVSDIKSSTLTGNSVSGGGTGSALYSWYGNVHFNRIFNNADPALTEVDYTHTADNSIEAQNNWWGTNDNPSSHRLGNVTYSPWLMLCATATPPTIPLGDISSIDANLTFNNASIDTSALGFVPDEIPVAFAVTAGGGSLSQLSGETEDGKNATAFSPTATGISTIRTNVDGQSVYTDVLVPVTARFTGTPVSGPAPLTVQFNDTSDCSIPLMWNWSLGDGSWFNTTDILQRNVSYTYASPGFYTVSLTIANAGSSDTSTRTDYISVLIPPPAVTGITPATGINTTTIGITNLAGTGFNTTHTPVAVKLNRTGYPDITATNVLTPSTSQISCTFDLTGQEAGFWNVVVTNSDGQDGLLASGFEIQTATPSVTSIDPATGFNSSTVDITNLAGDGFWTGSSTTGVVLHRGGYTDIDGTGVTVLSAMQITCTLDLTGHAAGLWDVVVTNPDGKTATLPASFEIFPPVPAVTGIVPAYGVNTSTIGITNLAGSGFWPGSTTTGVILNRTGYPDITASGVTVVDGTNITCTFDLTGQEEGLWNVVVTNPDGQEAMLANGFRIWAPGPGITSITPASGVNTSTISITDLAGSGFWTAGTTVVILNRTGYPDIVATGVTVVDETTITCTFDLTGQEEGLRNVVVTNPDGQVSMLPDGFRIWAPAPVVTAITPASAVNSTPVSITSIAGSGFWTTGTITVILNQTGYPDIVATGVTIVDSTNITCTFDLTGQEAGLRNVVVTNPDGQEAILADGFTVRIPGPGITGITPASGLNTAPLNITRLAGSGFWTSGTTNVFLNRTGYADIVATNVTVVDSTNITCTFDLTGQRTGLWNVVVTNPDGQEMVFSNGFRIRIPGPEPVPVPPFPIPTLDTSGNSDDGPTVTLIPTKVSCGSGIRENVSVNIGGSSAISRADVSGSEIADLIVTGTVISRPDNDPWPQGTVYQYIALAPARYCSIASAGLSFTVPQSWLEENHIAPGNIVLYRQTEKGWEALPTTVLTTKDGTVYFSSQSTMFSIFAIAGTPAVVPSPELAPARSTITGVVGRQASQQAAVTVTQEPIVSETTVAPAPAEASAGPSAFPIVPALVGIGCIGLIGGGWYIRRWWVRRQNPALFAEYD